MKNKYEQFSDDQLEKIGNTIIYLLNKIDDVPKTKLLKLLYILDEEAMKRSGMPFLNLKYKVWHLGPVAEEIFNDLSSDEVTLLSEYISIKERVAKATYYNTEKEFCNDEFSKSDIKFLDEIIKDFGGFSAEELVKYTHREGSLWNQIAEENGILKGLENEEIPSTNLKIDLSRLIENDEFKKSIFNQYKLYN
jgi:uncharacterized phage-associated protein